MTTSDAAARILLCACPLHGMQVLKAARQAGVPLHQLDLCTQWPEGQTFADGSTAPAPTRHVLWALLPPHAAPEALSVEGIWREGMLQDADQTIPGLVIHMLYGTTEQQAQQMRPWVPNTPSDDTIQLPCLECLDGACEQQLFQRLLRP